MKRQSMGEITQQFEKVSEALLLLDKTLEIKNDILELTNSQRTSIMQRRGFHAICVNCLLSISFYDLSKAVKSCKFFATCRAT